MNSPTTKYKYVRSYCAQLLCTCKIHCRQCLHCTVIQVPFRLRLSGGETRFSLHPHEKLDSSFLAPNPPARPTADDLGTPFGPQDSRGLFAPSKSQPAIKLTVDKRGRQPRHSPTAHGPVRCGPQHLYRPQPPLQPSIHTPSSGWMFALHHLRSLDAAGRAPPPSARGGLPVVSATARLSETPHVGIHASKDRPMQHRQRSRPRLLKRALGAGV